MNYKIRLSILNRQRAEEEAKIAYVHLVQITDYVALELVVRQFAKLLEPVLNDPKDPALPENSDFELSHGFAAAISEMINQIEEEKINELSSLASILDPVIEGFDKIELSVDELAKMSKIDIHYYHQFSMYASHIKATLNGVKIAIETRNLKMVSPETIYGLWQAAVKFFRAATSLRVSLIQSSKINQDYAEKILNERFSELWEAMRSNYSSESSLKAAVEHIKEQNETKSNNGN